MFKILTWPPPHLSLKTCPPFQNYYIHLRQKPVPSTVPSFPWPSKLMECYNQCCESFSIQSFSHLPPTPPIYFSKYMHTFDPGRRVATERGNNAGLSGRQKDRERKRGTGRWCVGARSIFTARLEVSRFGAGFNLLPAMWVYLATSHSVCHFGFGKNKIREITCSINENKLVHFIASLVLNYSCCYSTVRTGRIKSHSGEHSGNSHRITYWSLKSVNVECHGCSKLPSGRTGQIRIGVNCGSEVSVAEKHCYWLHEMCVSYTEGCWGTNQILLSANVKLYFSVHLLLRIKHTKWVIWLADDANKNGDIV